MYLIWTTLIGLVAGLVARALMQSKGLPGFFVISALGIGGALAAMYLGEFLGWYQPGQSAEFFSAVIGAIALLRVFHLGSRT